MSLALTRFNHPFVRDREGKCRSFFFSPISLSLYLLSLTHTPSFFFSFFFPLRFFLLSFSSLFFHLTHRIFFFLQVRGSFLSLYYSSCHVSPFPWSMCHMDTCSRWNSPHHMALMPCVLLPWCHVASPGRAMWHYPMCHPTPDASENVKFRSSQNSMKFN